MLIDELDKKCDEAMRVAEQMQHNNNNNNAAAADLNKVAYIYIASFYLSIFALLIVVVADYT